MRNLPKFVAYLLIALSAIRVEGYARNVMGAGAVLSWLFAIGLGLSVYVGAYWLKDRKKIAPLKSTKSIKVAAGNGRKHRRAMIDIVIERARLVMIVAMVIDTVLNIAEALRVMPEQSGAFEVIATVVFGASPTILASGLAWFQGSIDKLPQTSAKRNAWDARAIAFALQWRNFTTGLQGILFPPRIKLQKEAKVEAKYRCKCKWESTPGTNPRREASQWAQHVRFCPVKERDQSK